MFFVFGPSGQMYRGGPENLAKISPVRSVRRPLALRARLDPQGDGAAPFPLPPPPAQTTAPTPPTMTLRAQDAVSAYARTEQGPQVARQPLTRVSDVMTRGALTVTPTMRVHDAWHLLSEHHIGQAPVLNAQGHVVGLLLRSDIAPQELLPAPGNVGEQLALVRRLVAEAMVSPVPTVSVDTELRRVAQVLLDTGLPGLPVTDEWGSMAGFVSRTDILRAVAADPPLDLWS